MSLQSYFPLPTMTKPKASKPWYKSLTIKSAIATGLTVALSPAVLNVVPPKVANALAIVGAVSTAIGLRRAVTP